MLEPPHRLLEDPRRVSPPSRGPSARRRADRRLHSAQRAGGRRISAPARRLFAAASSASLSTLASQVARSPPAAGNRRLRDPREIPSPAAYASRAPTSTAAAIRTGESSRDRTPRRKGAARRSRTNVIATLRPAAASRRHDASRFRRCSAVSLDGTSRTRSHHRPPRRGPKGVREARRSMRGMARRKGGTTACAWNPSVAHCKRQTSPLENRLPGVCRCRTPIEGAHPGTVREGGREIQVQRGS